MKTICKYFLHPDSSTIMMPGEPEFLSVQLRGNALCLWAVIDTDADLAAHEFNVYGTGWELPPHLGRFIDTVQQDGLVWHIFYAGTK